MLDLSSWFQTILDFIYPAACVSCRQFTGDDRILIFCRTCWNSIRLMPQTVCPRCGTAYVSETVLQFSPEFRCGACRVAPPFFDRALSAAYYDGVMQEAIHQFKFYRKTGLGQHLAQVLWSQLPESAAIETYHAIIPVPLHKTRQRQRGYNQSAILARYLAQHYHLEVMQGNLVRTRSTHEQALLRGRQARYKNIKNAFSVREPDRLCDRDVILLDDVYTTGATVNECAKTLKRAGAHSVFVLTLGRVDFQA